LRDPTIQAGNRRSAARGPRNGEADAVVIATVTVVLAAAAIAVPFDVEPWGCNWQARADTPVG
jgi:hypothetical protein